MNSGTSIVYKNIHIQVIKSSRDFMRFLVFWDRGPLKKGFEKMGTSHTVFNLRDKGGRRLGLERRRFSYNIHIPERRCGEDRRKSLDRRNDKDRRDGIDRRNDIERRSGEERAISRERRVGNKDRRSGVDRRSGLDRRDSMGP